MQVGKKETWEEYAERVQREHYEQREARLNETLTRRDVIEAIELVASDYAQGRNHDADLICNAFQRLADALR